MPNTNDLNIVLLKTVFDRNGDLTNMEVEHTFKLSLPHWSHSMFSSQPVEKIIEYEGKHYTLLKTAEVLGNITRYYAECQTLRLDGAKTDSNKYVRILTTMRFNQMRADKPRQDIVAFVIGAGCVTHGIHEMENVLRKEMSIYSYDNADVPDFIEITPTGIMRQRYTPEAKKAAYDRAEKAAKGFVKYARETPAMRLYYVEFPLQPELAEKPVEELKPTETNLSRQINNAMKKAQENAPPVPSTRIRVEGRKPETNAELLPKMRKIEEGRTHRSFATFNRELGYIKQLMEDASYSTLMNSLMGMDRVFIHNPKDMSVDFNHPLVIPVSIKASKSDLWKTAGLPHTASSFTKGTPINFATPMGLSLTTLNNATRNPEWMLRAKFKNDMLKDEVRYIPISLMRRTVMPMSSIGEVAGALIPSMTLDNNRFATIVDFIAAVKKAVNSNRRNLIRIDTNIWYRVNNNILDLIMDMQRAINNTALLINKFTFANRPNTSTSKMDLGAHVYSGGGISQAMISYVFSDKLEQAKPFNLEEINNLLKHDNSWRTMLERQANLRVFLTTNFRANMVMTQDDVAIASLASFRNRLDRLERLAYVMKEVHLDFITKVKQVETHGMPTVSAVVAPVQTEKGK